MIMGKSGYWNRLWKKEEKSKSVHSQRYLLPRPSEGGLGKRGAQVARLEPAGISAKAFVNHRQPQFRKIRWYSILHYGVAGMSADLVQYPRLDDDHEAVAHRHWPAGTVGWTDLVPDSLARPCKTAAGDI